MADHDESPLTCEACAAAGRYLLAAVIGAVLGLALALTGCTQAFVEVRHDRPSRLERAPDTTLSIGARWYFWVAYGQGLADKVSAAARESAREGK